MVLLSLDPLPVGGQAEETDQDADIDRKDIPGPEKRRRQSGQPGECPESAEAGEDVAATAPSHASPNEALKPSAFELDQREARLGHLIPVRSARSGPGHRWDLRSRSSWRGDQAQARAVDGWWGGDHDRIDRRTAITRS